MAFIPQPFGDAMNKVEYKLIQKEKTKNTMNTRSLKSYSFACKKSRITKIFERKDKNVENK